MVRGTIVRIIMLLQCVVVIRGGSDMLLTMFGRWSLCHALLELGVLERYVCSRYKVSLYRSIRMFTQLPIVCSPMS